MILLKIKIPYDRYFSCIPIVNYRSSTFSLGTTDNAIVHVNLQLRCTKTAEETTLCEYHNNSMELPKP